MMTHTRGEDGVLHLIFEGTTTFIEEMEGLNHVYEDEEDCESTGNGGYVHTTEDLVLLKKDKLVP